MINFFTKSLTGVSQNYFEGISGESMITRLRQDYGKAGLPSFRLELRRGTRVGTASNIQHPFSTNNIQSSIFSFTYMPKIERKYLTF